MGAFLMVATPAGSQTTQSTSTTLPVVTYNRACEATAETQIALDRCSGSELAEVQGQLNIALGKERQHLKARLVNAAEKAFGVYRSAECSAAAAVNLGGSIHPLVVSNCEIQLTVQRIQQVDSDTSYASNGR